VEKPEPARNAYTSYATTLHPSAGLDPVQKRRLVVVVVTAAAAAAAVRWPRDGGGGGGDDPSAPGSGRRLRPAETVTPPRGGAAPVRNDGVSSIPVSPPLRGHRRRSVSHPRRRVGARAYAGR